MSTEEITLVLEKRELVGKGLGKLKIAGKVPAVIHRPGEDSLVVEGSISDISKVYNKAGKHHPVHVTIGGSKLLTIIKEVDVDPTKRTLRHVVFGAIKQNEKVRTGVPVILIDEAPALKMALLVHQHIEEVEITALPKDLPDNLEVSVATLAEVGDKVTVSDIRVPAGIEIMTEPEETVAVVDAPHIQEEEPQETPAEAEAAAIAEMNSESTEETKE